jgi:hypothetical protein
MPVHRQKKDTTPLPSGSTQEQTAPVLPDQQTFRQYLRELAHSAIRVVLEDVMREELDALIGVGWGECRCYNESCIKECRKHKGMDARLAQLVHII